MSRRKNLIELTLDERAEFINNRKKYNLKITDICKLFKSYNLPTLSSGTISNIEINSIPFMQNTIDTYRKFWILHTEAQAEKQATIDNTGKLSVALNKLHKLQDEMNGLINLLKTA